MNFRCPIHLVIVGASSLIFTAGAFTPTAWPTSQRVRGETETNTCTSFTDSTTELYMNKKKGKGGKKKAARSTPKGFAGALRDLQMNTFQYAGGVKAGKQSPQKTVSDSAVIMKPDYSEDGIVSSFMPIASCIRYRAILVQSSLNTFSQIPGPCVSQKISHKCCLGLLK